MDEGVHDTFLATEKRRKIRCVLVTAVLRRFFGVFLLFTYITDRQRNTTILDFSQWISADKNHANHLQNSQYWLVTKSILQY